MLPHQSNDYSKIVLEIRQGVGGDEASLFVVDLIQAYRKYAEKHGLVFSLEDAVKNSLGGIKEAVIEISGKNAFQLFKYEGGVHRVQRIPQTERYGRIHTSTVSVVVIPYTENKTGNISIDQRDLKITTFRASGPGGQYVNKTDSAVRITHIPTNITVVSQDERSQHKNREKAMKILKLKLYLLQQHKHQQEIDSLRRNQIKTQERSFKIRTYNYKQNRITDHRIHKSFHNLQHILSGNLDIIVKENAKYATENK